MSQRSPSLRGEPLVEVLRGGAVESVHYVAACAVDRSGEPILALGEIDVGVFLRSSAKPFIAAAVLSSGAQRRFGFEQREIAIMAASHTGQRFHVDAVRSILRKIDLPETALQCGAHAPYNADAAKALEQAGITPTAIHNNCSGKHAGILALCKMLGADPRTYLDPDNPAEQRILDFCARISGVSRDSLALAVDGCGIPVYAVPLRNAALSFARLATLEGIEPEEAAALRTVREAMIAYPEYVSGTGEFDTRLMAAAEGMLVCKGGAEGVHASSFLRADTGLVCKVVDGAARGRAPAVLELLRALRALPEEQLAALDDLWKPIVYNRAGRPVGEVRARTMSENIV